MLGTSDSRLQRVVKTVVDHRERLPGLTSLRVLNVLRLMSCSGINLVRGEDTTARVQGASSNPNRS